MLAQLILTTAFLAGSGGPPSAEETIPWFGETFCERPILMQMTPDTPEMRLFLYGLGDDVCFSYKWGMLRPYLRHRPRVRDENGGSQLVPRLRPKHWRRLKIRRKDRRRSSRQFQNEMIIRQHCSWNGPLCVLS